MPSDATRRGRPLRLARHRRQRFAWKQQRSPSPSPRLRQLRWRRQPQRRSGASAPERYEMRPRDVALGPHQMFNSYKKLLDFDYIYER